MTTPIVYQGRKARRSGSEQRRKAILDAALRIIVRDGVRAVRHRAVAKEADVPLSATTYYFKDINDLINDTFTLFVERAVTHVIDPFREEAFRILELHGTGGDENDRQQLLGKLADIGTAFIAQEVIQHRDHLVAEQAFLQECAINPRLRELARIYLDHQLAPLAEVLRRLGSGAPELDAEFVLHNCWMIERRLLIAGEVDHAWLRARMTNMLRLVLGYEG